MIIVTERDMSILKILAKYGVVYIRDIDKNFFNGSEYTRKRLSKLEKEGFIIRNKRKFMYLGANGKNFLFEKGIKTKTFNYTHSYKERLAEIYHLLNKLSNFNSFTSTEVRDLNYEKLSSKRYMFYGKIQNNNDEYLIYKVKGFKKIDISEEDIISKKLYLKRLKCDICERLVDLNTNSVIIFFEDNITIDLYKEDSTPLNLNKEILLELNDTNINLVNEIVYAGLDKNDFIFKSLKRMGIENLELNNTNKPYDFVLNTHPKKYLFNLSNKNYKKELIINSYLNLFKQPETLSIICYSNEVSFYKNLYNNNIDIIELKKPILI